MDALSDRHQTILSLIIGEYVESAAPVASNTIVQKYQPAVSPATIRNAMFQLEQEGLIYQRHTSAGRVPSDQGYRYFVDRLMGVQDLDQEEKTHLQQSVEQLGLSVEEIVRISALLLAQMLGNASIVCMPSAPQGRIKHVELISVQDKTVMLVMLLLGGTLKQQIITLSEQVPESELSAVSHQLTELFRGLNAAQIEWQHSTLEGIRQEVRDMLLKILRQVDAGSFTDFHIEGLPRLMNQPEFDRSEKLRYVLDTLQQGAGRQLAASAMGQEGVRVQIGAENAWPSLGECSLVYVRYGKQGEAMGVIGAVGPTRMRYGRAVSSVRHLGRMLDKVVGSLC
jgi:heat-inducible transcriptional repressor